MPTLSLHPLNLVFSEPHVTDRTRPGAQPALYDQDYATYRAAWDQQEQIYQRCWSYWKGDIFDERRHDPAPGQSKGERYYPLRINEVRRATVIHALNIFGLTSEAPYLRLLFKPKRTTVASAQARADRLSQLASDWLKDCAGEELLREQARLFMILGGCVLKVRPDDESPFGFMLEAGSVRHFYPVWHPTRYNQLLRCHFKFPIDRTAATELFGYQPKDEQQVYFLETWTKEQWQVQIGKEEEWQQAVDPESGSEYRGANTNINPATGRQTIPVFYIPRLRTGAFYGENLPDEIRGLQDELNARYADTGDAVSLSSRMHVVASDVSRRRQGGERLRLPLDPMEIYDLGDTIAGQESPKAYTLDAPSPAESALAYNDQLEAKLYDLAGIPDVMRGRVEGTQRSGEALAALTFPSQALINDYRSPFKNNLEAAWLAFMSMSQQSGQNKIGLDDFGHEMDMEFAPVLPRDVGQINDTIAIQRSAGTMSRPRALELSPDVTNPAEELKLIEEEEAAKQAFQQAQAELQARARQQQAAGKPSSGGKGNSNPRRPSSARSE